MPTQPTLPAWITSRTGAKHLASGDLRARVKRTCTTDGWNAHVWRNDDPLAADWVFCSTDFPDGKIIGEEIARAICEAIVREALRAKAAEKRVRGLLCEGCLDGEPLSADRKRHVDGNGSQQQECQAYEDATDDTPPIEDVIEKLAAEAPAEDWDKLARDPRTIDALVAEARAGPADWAAFRRIAREILDADWAELLEARGEDESA